MGKLIKYEARKNLQAMTRILIGACILEALFAYNVITENYNGAYLILIPMILFLVICYFLVFIGSVTQYSRELNSKVGFMLFMTPRSTSQIVWGKLIYTVISGAILAVLLVVVGIVDINWLLNADSVFSGNVDLISELLEMFSIDPTRYVLYMITYVLIFVLNFLTMIMLAYLAVTLAATYLQSSPLRGFLSLLMFLVFAFIIYRIGDALPTPIRLKDVKEAMDVVIYMLPAIALQLVCMIASVFGCCYLLERKINL